MHQVKYIRVCKQEDYFLFLRSLICTARKEQFTNCKSITVYSRLNTLSINAQGSYVIFNHISDIYRRVTLARQPNKSQPSRLVLFPFTLTHGPCIDTEVCHELQRLLEISNQMVLLEI